MSDDPEQPKRNLFEKVEHKFQDKLHKAKDNFRRVFSHSPTPSEQPTRSTTPVPNQQASSLSATAINPESTPSRVDNGGNSPKGGDTVKTDTSDFDWQAWNIDGDAISELRVWGAGHENSNWRKLADKIDQSLKSETVKAVQDFIPDSPFPAKTLVKALLSIVQLGINIPRIQKEVYEFAQEAIEYIRTLVEAVGEEQTLKPDLVQICTTVNNICGWAREHVRKKNLSTDDLEDWNSKFVAAKQIFLTTTVISIRVEQERTKRMGFIKEKLANHVATKHEYTDQSKSLCAPGTRVKIQTDILEWLSSQTSSSEHIFWITGIAGSGKSTLSATVADTLRTMGTPVAAQFFISRNIPETTDPDKMIPTIAKQLSEFSPAAARVIQDALKHGFISPRTEQVQKLLLAPIREICKSHDRVIILIDALDELEKADESVLQILSPIAASDLPDNIRFLITSRPERWADIRSQTLELAVFKEHSLLTDSSVQEVHNFIVAKMQEITPKKQGWDSWPTQDQLSELSRTADGLFHYATTALQWIKEQISNDGVSCQTWVFQKFTALGIGQLENLYKLILTSFEDTDHVGKDAARRGHRLRGFQHIIGTIIVLYKPLTIYQIIDLLADIPKTEFDVDNFLEQFCSVLIPGMTTSFMEATPQMHKSFRDYITGAHAPEEFCIPVGHAHFVTARSCLEVIVKAGSSSDAVVQYSVAYWCQHLRKAVEGQVDFGDEGGIWNLFERMTEEAVVSVWKPNAWDIFRDVATAGWKLLQKGTDKHRMEGISAIVVKAKELEERRVRRWENLELEEDDEERRWENLLLASLEERERRLRLWRRLLEELEELLDEEVHAFPLSTVLALLTVPCLLISTGRNPLHRHLGKWPS